MVSVSHLETQLAADGARSVDEHDPTPGAHPPRSTWLPRVLVAGDVFVIAAALAGTAALLAVLFGWNDRSRVGVGSVDRVLALTAIAIALLRLQGLYRSARSAVVTFEIVSIFRVGAGIVAGSVVLDQLAGIDARWAQPTVQAVVTVILLVLWRSSYRGSLRAARRSGRFVRPITIVGTDAEAARVLRLLTDHEDSGYRCVGVVGDREVALANGLGAQWAGDIDEARRLVENGLSTGVIIVTSALTATETNRVIRDVQHLGGHIHIDSALASVDSRRITTQPIAFEPVLYLEPPRRPTLLHRAIKRGIDITLASIGLVLIAPLLFIAVVAIRLTSGGPVLFRQRRIGLDGEPFTMFKLRTMVDGAEGMTGQLAHLNDRQGPLFKIEDDPRVTRIGRLLRATDLDEAPQLLNVLRGDMSLVGPRPALPHEVEEFGADLRRRLTVPPGITGLWQVESRDNPSFEAYERLDLLYVENRSITLDLVILLLTFECKVAQRMTRWRHEPDTQTVVRAELSDAGRVIAS